MGDAKYVAPHYAGPRPPPQADPAETRRPDADTDCSSGKMWAWATASLVIATIMGLIIGHDRTDIGAANNPSHPLPATGSTTTAGSAPAARGSTTPLLGIPWNNAVPN
jgi:hypothetical protein